MPFRLSVAPWPLLVLSQAAYCCKRQKKQSPQAITNGITTRSPLRTALIEQGLLTPEEIVTHHMPLEEAARGYQIFEKREEACRKVILVPGMQPGKATL